MCLFRPPQCDDELYHGVGADTAATFAAYTAKVAALLRSLGLDAEAGSRNDVTIGPERRKVSGGAFYRIGNRSIAHGTMLYSVDTERMAAALTPSAAKLRSKGIESVRSRVTCITRYRPDLSLDEFMARARSFMTDSDVVLTPRRSRPHSSDRGAILHRYVAPRPRPPRICLFLETHRGRGRF